MHLLFFVKIFGYVCNDVRFRPILMLEDIKAHIAELISLYESEKQRADNLAAILVRNEEMLKSCKEQITDLNQQIDNLKLQIAFSGCDNVLAKERIDRMIHEIDKCIKLLEK